MSYLDEYMESGPVRFEKEFLKKRIEELQKFIDENGDGIITLARKNLQLNRLLYLHLYEETESKLSH